MATIPPSSARQARSWQTPTPTREEHEQLAKEIERLRQQDAESLTGKALR
jgi:hypothetical protein